MKPRLLLLGAGFGWRLQTNCRISCNSPLNVIGLLRLQGLPLSLGVILSYQISSYLSFKIICTSYTQNYFKLTLRFVHKSNLSRRTTAVILAYCKGVQRREI